MSRRPCRKILNRFRSSNLPDTFLEKINWMGKEIFLYWEVSDHRVIWIFYFFLTFRKFKSSIEILSCNFSKGKTQANCNNFRKWSRKEIAIQYSYNVACNENTFVRSIQRFNWNNIDIFFDKGQKKSHYIN
mgnify:CR=1 FL=1